MKTQFLGWMTCLALAGALDAESAERSVEPGNTSATVQAQSVPARTSDRKQTAPAQTPQKLSPGVADIVKLVEAGIEPVVIEAYIKNSKTRFDATADDILHLHRLGVSPQILTTLLEQAGGTRPGPQGAPSSASVAEKGTDSRTAESPQQYQKPAEAPIYTYLYPPYSVPWVVYPGQNYRSRYQYAYPTHRYYPFYSYRYYSYPFPPYFF